MDVLFAFQRGGFPVSPRNASSLFSVEAFRFHRGGLSRFHRGGLSVLTFFSTSPSAGPKREPMVALFGFSLLTAIMFAGPAHPQHGSLLLVEDCPAVVGSNVGLGVRWPPYALGFLAPGLIASRRRRTSARTAVGVEDIPVPLAGSQAWSCGAVEPFRSEQMNELASGASTRAVAPAITLAGARRPARERLQDARRCGLGLSWHSMCWALSASPSRASAADAHPGHRGSNRRGSVFKPRWRSMLRVCRPQWCF